MKTASRNIVIIVQSTKLGTIFINAINTLHAKEFASTNNVMKEILGQVVKWQHCRSFRTLDFFQPWELLPLKVYLQVNNAKQFAG